MVLGRFRPKPQGFRTVANVLEKYLLYYDRGIVLLNKPNNLVCQMSKANHKGHEKFNILCKGIQKKLDMPELPRSVHRLDKDTTGALLLARSSVWAVKLQNQFLDGSIKKTYLALVHGGEEKFQETSGVIEAPLSEVDGFVRLDPQGKKTRTEWEVLGSSPKVPLTLLRLNLLTGHKHQLRIHLAECLEAPILGDKVYGSELHIHDVSKVVTVPKKRMFLHASELSLQRFRKSGPKRRFELSFRVPVPTKFKVLCRDAKIPVDPEWLKGEILVSGEPCRYPGQMGLESDECWVSSALLLETSQKDSGTVHNTLF